MKKILLTLITVFMSIAIFSQYTNSYTYPLYVGKVGTSSGSITLYGTTSGTAQIKVADVAGTGIIFQFPITNGTDGQFLSTNGSGVLTWAGAAPVASPTFTGTVVIPTPFTLGAVSVTSTGTQFNYLNAATGTTGTTTTNLVYSASPTLTAPALGTPSALIGTNISGTATSLTAGKATVLATTRAIYGNNFNGSAALTQIIGSAYGGTGNGFTKFTGPLAAEKTFTLPNASARIITDADTADMLDTYFTAADAIDGDDYYVKLLPDTAAYTDAHTLVLTDAGRRLYLTKATVIEITIPPNADVAFVKEQVVYFEMCGAGIIHFAEGAGVTIHAPLDSLYLNTQYGWAFAKYCGNDRWDIGGTME